MNFAINFCSRLSLKNNRKFLRKLLPEGPRSLQNGFGRPPGELSARFRHQRAFLWPKNETREDEFSHFWPQSGARPEPENRPKIDFLRKKRRQGRHCCRFLPRVLFFSIFPSISARFSVKNRCFFERGFLTERMLFSKWRPSR